jgi:hypothetical protein
VPFCQPEDEQATARRAALRDYEHVQLLCEARDAELGGEAQRVSLGVASWDAVLGDPDYGEPAGGAPWGALLGGQDYVEHQGAAPRGAVLGPRDDQNDSGALLPQEYSRGVSYVHAGLHARAGCAEGSAAVCGVVCLHDQGAVLHLEAFEEARSQGDVNWLRRQGTCSVRQRVRKSSGGHAGLAAMSTPWALYSEEGVVALRDLHPEASPSGSSDSECTQEGCD